MTKQILAFMGLLLPMAMEAQTLTVEAQNIIGHVSPLIYGSGAEDVNHEIYGGLYDQCIFGEIASIRSLCLAGNQGDENTPRQPARFVPVEENVTPGSKLTLKPYSYTVFVITSDSAQGIATVAEEPSSAKSQTYDIEGRKATANTHSIIVRDGKKALMY